jgi:hypothetical protein
MKELGKDSIDNIAEFCISIIEVMLLDREHQNISKKMHPHQNIPHKERQSDLTKLQDKQK